MATYQAVLMHGNRGGEGRYDFQAPEGLVTTSARRTLSAFTDHIKHTLEPRHVDWQVSQILRNDELGVVTALGTMSIEAQGRQPFVCMIHQE